MHPVLRRILLHGGLTAAVLAVVGVMFAELASVWLIGNATRGTDAGADARIGAALRFRVPLTLALWGFLFVLVGEIVVWRVRGNRSAAPKPVPSPQDDAEKLLNELLAQAEAKMAQEGKGPPPADENSGADKPAAPQA